MKRIDLVCGLAFSLLASSAALGADEAPSFPSPAETSVPELWERFLDTATLSPVMASYESLEGVVGDDAEAVPEACREQAGAMDAAVRVNPVSLALWFYRYRCGVVLAEQEREQSSLAAFEALLVHAMDGYSREPMRPIRVVNQLDAYALLLASGQQRSDAYLDAWAYRSNLPLWVSLQDADSGSERLLAFDYLDTVIRLARDEPTAELPLFRRQVALSLVDNDAQAGYGHGVAAQKVLDLGGVQGPARVEGMIALAKAGNLLASSVAAASCLVLLDVGDCAEATVDALIPTAERGNPFALAWLAHAHAMGHGVRRDIKAARAMLAKADERLGGWRGTQLYLHMVGAKQAARWVRKTVEQAARDGDPQAQIYAVLLSGELDRPRPLSRKMRAWLVSAAEAGDADAQAILGNLLLGEGRTEAAIDWLAKGAQSNEHAAMRLAEIYDTGEFGVAQRPDRALALRIRAANLGADDAGRLVAFQLIDGRGVAPDAARAERWLESAVWFGNDDAKLALANLLSQARPGVRGTPADAVELYRELLADHDLADARRGLAELLLYGDGVERDPATARTLLQQDADAGDTQSQLLLGSALVDGEFEAADPEAGLAWLRKAADAGDARAILELGAVFYYGRAGAVDQPQGMALWRKAVESGDDWAVNNLAWAYCTSMRSELLDPGKGVELIDGLIARGEAQPAFVDTQAACRASAGDFEGASAVQEAALADALKVFPDASPMHEEMRERLALYRAGKTYVETVSSE